MRGGGKQNDKYACARNAETCGRNKLITTRAAVFPPPPKRTARKFIAVFNGNRFSGTMRRFPRLQICCTLTITNYNRTAAAIIIYVNIFSAIIVFILATAVIFTFFFFSPFRFFARSVAWRIHDFSYGADDDNFSLQTLGGIPP